MGKDYSAEINYPEEEAVDYREFETEEEMEQWVADETEKAEDGGYKILIDKSTD
jgi:hypothetical protein